MRSRSLDQTRKTMLRKSNKQSEKKMPLWELTMMKKAKVLSQQTKKDLTKVALSFTEPLNKKERTRQLTRA